MANRLLEFSFKNVQSSDWAYFEKFASQFLNDDFRNITTVASPSGDHGRDAELRGVDGKPALLLQYSITGDWKNKVTDTLKKLKKNFPLVKQLHYVTNEQIGALSDEMVQLALDKYEVMLFFKDASWFLDRCESSKNRISATQYLIDSIALPITRHLETDRKRIYSRAELELANLNLSLKTLDNLGSENFTKQVYDNMVLAVLSTSTTEGRVTYEKVVETIKAQLTNVTDGTLTSRVDAALERLKKKKIKHFEVDNTYHISYEAQLDFSRNVLIVTELEKDFDREIVRILSSDDKLIDQRKVETVAADIHKIVQKLFQLDGEAFTRAIDNGFLEPVEKYQDNIANMIAGMETTSSKDKLLRASVYVLKSLYASEVPSTKQYLRFLAKNYTYRAFLQLTDDVQKIVSKINTDLKIWLDTNVILPLLGEEISSEEKVITGILHNVTKNGAKLYITTGVLDEVIAHLKKSLTFHHYRVTGQQWVGSIPYYYEKYLASGIAVNSFKTLVERFFGDEYPQQDMKNYLSKFHNIKVLDHDKKLAHIGEELQLQLTHRFEEEHDRRRSEENNTDVSVIKMLARHDVENFLGVLSQRKGHDIEVSGHSEWFLTFDRAFWNLVSEFSAKYEIWGDHKSPLISVNFLLHVMSFVKTEGPADPSPLVFYELIDEEAEADVVKIADKIRKEHQDLEDHLLERKIRSEVDEARRSRFVDMFH